MTEVSTRPQVADDFCKECGYEPELKRTLGSFQVFAISFAFISVAVGIFGTYDYVLQNGGPVGIWLWPIVVVGQILVALVIAQFAARIPLTGSSYQWASRLANPRIGWVFGWLTFCYLGIAVVAVDNALASTAFMPLVGLEPNESVARLITLVTLLIQAVLAIASTRIVGMINAAAVGVEVVIVGALVIALGIAVAITGVGSAANLTSRGITENAPNYFAIGGGLMMAMIMGLTTLTGFEAAANLAEEAKDPYRSVPRAIVGSVVAAGLLGLLFLIALTFAMHDIPRSAPATPGRGDPARSARSGDGEDAVGRDHVRVLRRRDGDHDHVLADRLRDGARLTLPGPSADAAGRPAHANAHSGDDPRPRRGGHPDGGDARRRTPEADHGVDDPSDAPLCLDDRPLLVGAPDDSIARRAGSTSGATSCRSRSARWSGASSRCLFWWRPQRRSSPS